MVKTEKNPDGTPIEVFDGFRKALAANRAQFFLDVASGPFYGFNRPGAKASQGIIQNWWRQGMMGSALAHYEGIKAFSETDQTGDLKAITVPTLVQCRATMIKSYPTKTLHCCRPSCSRTWHAQDLPGLPTRHDDHECRRDQRGHPRIHQRGGSQGCLMLDRSRFYGLAPLRRAALLARKVARSSVQLAAVLPLLLYAAKFRD
jgi:hypothetical protein